jgi:hypothetical protein
MERASRIGLWVSLLIFAAHAKSLRPSRALQLRMKHFFPAVAIFTVFTTKVLEKIKVLSVPLVGVVMVPWAVVKCLKQPGKSKQTMYSMVQPLVLYASIPLYSDVMRQLFFNTNQEEEDSELDIAALVAIFVGVCREQNVAAFVILMMVTGGEALEQ